MPEISETQEMPTWDEFLAVANLLAGEDKGEWAGVPAVAETIGLVLEPRYPFQGLDGITLYDIEHPEAAAAAVVREAEDRALAERFEIVNTWWCEKRCATVNIIHDRETGNRRASWMQNNCYADRFEAMMDRFDPARYMNEAAEIRAVNTLRDHINDNAFRFYVLLGSFIETSEKSGVTYIFRKLAPTIALTPRPSGRMRILTTLCMHPIGYYQGTSLGAMVPTDDVIAHLLMMRGDERKFWSKAEHHHPRARAANL